MREVQHHVTNGAVELAGTLSGPSHPSDMLVICLHGSGPLDRDENYKAQRLNVFRPIADALAEAGIDCYRYDKRGCGQSTGSFNKAGFTELLEDALAVLGDFRESGQYKNIILLGHSEGTAIAALAAQDTIEGMILLCPFITPMDEILRRQAAEMEREIGEMQGFAGVLVRGLFRLIGTPTAQQRKLITRVRERDEDGFRKNFKYKNAKWLRELLNLNLSEVYPLIYCPTLIVKAGKDVQCPPEDSDNIAQMIGQHATLAEFPNLTHLLRDSDAAPGFQDYRNQLKNDISPTVTSRISEWLVDTYLRQSQTDEGA